MIKRAELEAWHDRIRRCRDLGRLYRMSADVIGQMRAGIGRNRDFAELQRLAALIEGRNLIADQIAAILRAAIAEVLDHDQLAADLDIEAIERRSIALALPAPRAP